MTIKLIISWITGMSILGGASAKTYCYYNCKSKVAKKFQKEKGPNNSSLAQSVS